MDQKPEERPAPAGIPAAIAELGERIAAAVHGPLLVLDGELRIISANSAFCESFKTAAGKVVGQPLGILADGRWDVPELRAALLQAQKRKEAAGEIEIEPEFPAIGRRALRVRPRAARESDGAAGLVLLAIRDVTDNKRAEEELARQRALIERAKKEWTAVFDSINEPVLIHDKDFRIVRANRAYAHAAGLEFGDVIGRPYWEVFPRRDGPLPECREGTDTGAIGSAELVLASGEAYLSRAYPVLDDQGTYQFSVHVFENITRSKSAQEALRLSEERFRGAFETAGHGMALVGLDGRFLEVNDRWTQIVGYGREELLHKDFQSITHPDDLDADLAHVNRLLDGEATAFEMEKRYIRKDGKIVWIRLNVGLVRDAARKPLYFVSQIQDITERKRAEAAARETLQRTQAQLEVVGRVARAEALLAGDVEDVAREITEHAAKATGCERVNAWLFAEGETELRCIDLYEATPRRHSAGMVLQEREFRREFEVLKSSAYVDADDPLTDPRTQGYVEGYLKPLGITSMLDAVIKVSDRHLGLLCFEHVNKPHHWEQDEIAFACQLADKIGLAIANRTRREAEEKLRASEAVLTEAQAIAHVGNWEFDCRRKILTWSDEVYRIFGVDRATFVPSYESFLARVHPDDRAAVDKDYVDSVANRTLHDIDHRILMDDGSIRTVHERGQTYYDAASRPVRSVGTVYDITERKRAEEMLVASRDLLQSVVESAPVRIFWKDPELRYLGCNTAFARDAGMSRPEELIGKDDFQMGWREQAESYRADDKRVMDSGTPKLGYEEPSTTPDGRAIWLRTSKVPLHDDAGKVIGMLGVYEDVTERKRAEEEIRTKTDRLERFQRLTVGRELDMARLKQEINALLRELGRPERYEARAKAGGSRPEIGAGANVSRNVP